MPDDVEAVLLEIARRNVPTLATLDTQGSDRLDFHEVSVSALRAALHAAYAAGRVAK